MARRDSAPRRRAGRRFGYAVSVVVNLVLWYLVNVRPGWSAVPFLTDDLTQVLDLFNLSVLAGAAVAFASLFYDPPWFVAATDVGLALVSVVLSWRLLEVFPIDFSGLGYDLTTLARVLLVVGLVGSVLALIAGVVRFGREVYRAAGGAHTV